MKKGSKRDDEKWKTRLVDSRAYLPFPSSLFSLGPEFGTSEETESIFRRISRQPRAAPKNGTLTTAMFDKGVSNFRATTHELTTCGDCKNDEEVNLSLTLFWYRFRRPEADFDLSSRSVIRSSTRWSKTPESTTSPLVD